MSENENPNPRPRTSLEKSCIYAAALLNDKGYVKECDGDREEVWQVIHKCIFEQQTQDKILEKYPTKFHKMIIDSLKWLAERQKIWGLETEINVVGFVDDLVNRID